MAAAALVQGGAGEAVSEVGQAGRVGSPAAALPARARLLRRRHCHSRTGTASGLATETALTMSQILHNLTVRYTGSAPAASEYTPALPQPLHCQC